VSRGLAFFGLGVTGGVLVAWAASPTLSMPVGPSSVECPSPPVRAADRDVVPSSAQDGCAGAAFLEERQRYLDEQLDLYIEHVLGPDDDAKLAEGEPLAWPDGSDGTEVERHTRAWFDANLPEHVTLIELDCDEYPCLAVLEAPDEEDRIWEHDATLEELRREQRARAEDPDSVQGMLTRWSREHSGPVTSRGLGNGDTTTWIVTLDAPGVPPERLKLRQEAAVAATSARRRSGIPR